MKATIDLMEDTIVDVKTGFNGIDGYINTWYDGFSAGRYIPILKNWFEKFNTLPGRLREAVDAAIDNSGANMFGTIEVAWNREYIYQPSLEELGKREFYRTGYNLPAFAEDCFDFEEYGRKLIEDDYLDEYYISGDSAGGVYMFNKYDVEQFLPEELKEAIKDE